MHTIHDHAYHAGDHAYHTCIHAGDHAYHAGEHAYHAGDHAKKKKMHTIHAYMRISHTNSVPIVILRLPLRHSMLPLYLWGRVLGTTPAPIQERPAPPPTKMFR